MATEADVPEAICIAKGEGVDRSLAIEQLDKTVDQCFPVELSKSKGDLDQHPEIHTDKPFADGENVQVEYSMKVQSKNNSFGISEGEHFLDPLSEISQADQSNQAGMEVPKNEAQLQKGTQVGEGVEETGTEENEVIEERKEKFEQDIEKHDIVNAAGIISEKVKTGDANLEVEEVEESTNETTVDQHVQVISNQQDSIKEDVQCLEKEESSEVDIIGAEKADGNAESYHKEASDLLEATIFQEYEASISTLDLTDSSFKKDIELETNVHNTSDTNPILQEEFEEETSTKVTSNDEKDSQQTLQNYEPKEELQKFPEVTLEDAKAESAIENAEVISCTEEARTLQNTPEFFEKEEANPVHCPKENDTITEEVFEATSTEKETAEHALPEIHTAENHPQEFNEEKSRDYQASVEAADLSTDTEEKKLEEQAIEEKSSSLVEEETTQQISREEEVHATNSKEEEKEADTKCEEPIEVADTTREIEFENIEQRTETNKDLNVPIPEEEAYAEESTKEFVQNNSFLSEVSEVKTKEIIQENHPTVSDYGLVYGEVSQVSALKEAEAENEEHVNNTPEEKGLQTILTDETVVETGDHAQAGENLTSIEKIEKEIQTAEGEGERDLKEFKEEDKEPVDNAGIAPEEGLATILTDQPALHIEDIELQAEESVDSKDKSEEQILTAADEGGNGFIEAQTENKEQVTDADIASEEKGPETILTDETALDIKDIDVQAEKDFSSKENLEKQVPVVADEGDTCLKEAEEEKEQEALPTILTGEPPLDIEVIDVQAEESFSPQEKLEELIPAVADEGDTGLKEAEEENKEQVKITDSAPEEKVTIGERALDNEDIELQVEEIVSSKDNLEKQIPTTADEGDTGLKEPEEENKEQVKSIDISTEDKGLATILTDETTHDAEDTDVKAGEYIKSTDIEGESCSTEPQEENKEKVTYTGITPEETILNSQEKLEEQVPVVADEGDTGLNEAEEENKEQIKSKDTSPEEKGLPIISTDDTALDSDRIELQSEENVSSTDNLEKQIPTEEAEHGLTEAEAENKEQATITDITTEVKSVPTTLTDQTALDSEKIELHAEENVNSTDYLEKQIPTAADEGEDILTEAKAETKEQVTITDITPEEKGVATILTDERSLEIEDIDVQAEESSNSKENLEEEISAAPVLGDTCVKEDEKENKEQVKSSDSSHEGKGLATILTEETTQDIEYTDVKAGADFNSGDILEKQIPTAVYEGETDSKEVEAENKEQVETTEIAPEEKGLATILIDETAEGIEVIDVQAGEINSKEVLEKQIPTALDEGETDLKEAEADIKEQVETTDIVPEQKGVETILSDERALDLEDVHVQEQENFNSNENLESQIPTTVGEGETDLNEGEAEIKEQVKCTETGVEEKDVTTILRDETVVEVQDVDIKAEEKPIEAGEGEKKVGILDDIPVNVYNTELVEEVTVEQSYQVPSHEEAEPKIAVENEKSEDHPERNHMIVEEVIDEPKITSRDFSEEQIIEGNVASSTPESIEEDTVKSSQDNEKETIELKEEGSCTENAKDENASDLTREYIPEDAPKQIKDEHYNAVKSENEILEDSQTIEVDESTTCETKNIEKSEEIPSTLPVKYEEVQQGEESCTESTKEENASDLTREYVPEDATEQIKDEDCNAVESKNEILEDSQIVQVDESTTCETKNLETTEEIPSTLPVKYEEVQQGEGSYTESTKEENASDLTREYVLEDATEQIKDEDCNAVKSKNEIVEDSQIVQVDESTTCETKNLERSEEILSTLPVKYDEVQQGEGSSPAPTEPLKEDHTLSVQVAKDDDGDNGAVNITETGAKVPPNDEEDSPEVLQKYEPEEEITELPHVKPEETTPESSSENAEVITCTKEEIQESLDKEKDTKESDTSSGEVLETTITEALPEIHTVEDTTERATEYQACIEAAELSTEGEKENSEEQTTREVSSSLIVETSEESSKEVEEKNEGQVECKDSIEEAKSETLEDTTEPKPVSEEESNKSLVEDNSFSSEASEKEIEKEIQGEYSSTVRSFDSEVVSDETGLTEATAEDKEQVETTQIAPEEKDNEGTDVHNTELVGEAIVEPSFQVQTLEEKAAPKLEVEDETDKSDDLPEKNNKICEEVLDEPKITDRVFNEEQITEGNIANLTIEPIEEQETVKDCQSEEKETEKLNEEGSSIENTKEGNANDISTECVPEDIDEKLKECIEETVESKEQIIEGKVASFTPESIEDDTVKNSEDSEKETIELKEEGSCTESIKEENASELSPEYIQEDGSKNFKDDKEDALKSEEEILEDSQTVGLDESTTCETINVERSEETLSALPVKHDEGSSPAPTEASKQENIDEDTSSVQETKDKDGAVTVTEASAEVPSNDEDDSPHVLQKYEPEEELTILRDVPPEEMKPEPSSEIEEVITCTKEETQESLDKEKDTKESDTSTGEACIEAAELSTEGEKEEQTTQEVSSSPIGEETAEESSKEEEKKKAHEECKETIEGDSSFLSKASEKEIEKEIQGEYSSTVRSFDSEVASGERGLTEATEQVETTHIAPEEKDIGGKDVYNTELVGETVEPSSQVQTLEEVETKLEVEDETDKSDDRPEKSDKICEVVLDEPETTDRDFHEEQITEGNVASCASGSVEEETVTDDQGEERETEKLNEEGSSIENTKESNSNDISTESVPKDTVKECTGEAVESKQEILQESQKDDRDEETFPIKVAGDNDDYNGTVVLPEASAEVTSIGEESSEVTQILELGEKHAQVETSDLADEIEVRDLEDKVSVAETTEEETKEVEVSKLALEKLDSDAPEEETTESSEVVPESDTKSTDVVAQDEIIDDQTLDEGISKEPSTLLSEEKEVKASEDEHAKEAEVPTEEDRGDLLAARSVEESCLPKEEPRELKVSELALERLDTGENEEETKETSETVSKSDSQSIGVVSEDEITTYQTQCEGEKEVKASELVQETLVADAPEEETKDGSAMVPKVDSESIGELVKEEIIADQTLPDVISTEQLQIPYTALVPEEKELKASEHEHETTSVDKNIEGENPKEVEVPADEDKQELSAATPTETCLQTEESRDTELALHKLDAGETEEEMKETFETVTKSDSQSVVVASGDDMVVDQTPCEGITDTPLSKERELGASEALEKLDDEDTEEIKEGPEIVPKFDSGIIEVVSNDEITIDQTFNEGVMKEQIQSPSSTLLPEEKEHETTAQDKSTEQECTKEVEVSADEDTQALLAARPVEEECLQKEEPSELNVSELALEKLDAGDTEEANETFKTVSRSDFPSIAADTKEEITADETLSKGVTDIPLEIPSYTSLHEEKEPKASELDLEKLDADTPEEEIKEGSEVIPQSVSQSSCEVSKDDIITDQLEIPSSAPLPDEKELKASEHEPETIIDDKNIEDENLKEVEEPTDEATKDVFVARSVEETCLQKEEPSELKVPELAPEKLEADETVEVKEIFERVSKSDSQSINAVSKDDTIADQTLCDVKTDMPLDIPSYTSVPKENEEAKEDVTELALEKLDADATEEVKKGSEVTPKSDLQSTDVVVKDEIIADQVLHEGITKEQLLIQSSTLPPEEKELNETEHELGTATQDKNREEEYAKEIEVTADGDKGDVFVASSEEKTHLQKEEPRELKVSELSPENVGEGEEEITATFESTDAVSREETIAEQALHQNDEQLQIASPTLLPKEKEEATEQKEELEDCKVLELSPKGETEKETKEAFETAPEVSSQSIGELPTDEIVNQILISEEKKCENTTTINNAGEESMSVVETPNDEGRIDTKSAEETSIPIEEPRELNVSDLDPSSQYTERDSSNEVHEEKDIYIDSNEAKKNEASNEEKNLKVATSDSKAEDSCETTIEANQTAKIQVPNEEIKEEKEVAKDSQLISIGEVNTRESQQENESRQEKYPEEKNDTFTAPSEHHHEVPEVDKTGSASEDIEKQVKPDDKSSMDHSQDEAEGRIQETVIHLGLENQGDEINCENSTTEVTYPVEKDSSVEVFQGVLGVEETDKTTQNTKQLEKESHATDIPSSKDDALNFLQDPKLEDSKPSNDTLVARETKEEKFCESGIETADPTSAQISLSERLMDESTKERMKVVTHLTEEKEPTVGKELQANEAEEEEHENVEEAKTDEDTEHKRAYQGYDEPVIVEASRDTEVKVTPKKSHNILSGMGSKVKHSISKVKKAIIGKSSNSKTQSEK
ncbi:hypothetical protein ABKV19_010789 [Rosa sericea]